MPPEDSPEAPSGAPPSAPPAESRGGFSRRDFLAGALLTGTLSAVGTFLTPGGSTPPSVTVDFITGSEPSGALDLLVRMWNQANPRAVVNLVTAGGESTKDQRDAMINRIEKGTADVLNLDIDPNTHPAWTGGEQKMLDRGGRVSRFNSRFGSLAFGKK